MSAFEDARDAICARASELSADSSPDDLVKLADAVQKVEFGPQGQKTTYNYNQRTEYVGTDRNGSTGFAR